MSKVIVEAVYEENDSLIRIKTPRHLMSLYINEEEAKEIVDRLSFILADRKQLKLFREN